MTKLIRKYQKWALAFFGVLLMLTFLGNRGTGNANEAADHVRGHLNGKAVSNQDIGEMRDELQALERYTTLRMTANRQSPILSLLAQFEEKPDLFYLLRQEALNTGATVNAAELSRFMTSAYQGPPAESDEYTLTNRGAADLLLVFGRFSQLQNDLKISRPVMDHMLAEENETIGVDIVQFQPAEYISKVSAPSQQQVQEQFDKFKDVDPHTVVPGSNPFGFGYKLPVRVQAQYLRVTPASIETAVEEAGPEGIAKPATWTLAQWWDLAGQKYYQAHLEDFRELPPADATTKPTAPLPIQPYTKVRDEVLGLIRQPLVDKLTDDLKAFFNSAISAGWQVHQQYSAVPPLPTTEPVTALGEQFTSLMFMQKVANQAHSKFNVIASVDDTQTPLPVAGLSQTPGLNNEQVIGFINSQASAFLQSSTPRTQAATSQLMRPSPAIQAMKAEPVVVIRLTGALPSESAKDLAAVRPSVEADLKTAAAYALAKVDADALLAAAGKGPLTIAAAAVNRPVVSTSPLFPLTLSINRESPVSPTDVIVPKLGPADAFFTKQAFTLLRTYDPKTKPTPATLIELQPISPPRLFVVQLKSVAADWTAESYFTTILRTRRAVTQAMIPRLAQKWFDYNEVVQRTGYKPVKSAG